MDMDRFEKKMDRSFSLIAVITVISAIVSIGFLVFIGWVVVKVLQHFGII